MEASGSEAFLPRRAGSPAQLALAALARLFRHGPKSASVLLRARLLNRAMLKRGAAGARTAQCPCCGYESAGFLHLDCVQFLVPSVACPNCESHERHRLLDLVMARRPPRVLAEPGRILVFAADWQVLRALDERPHLAGFCTDYGEYNAFYLHGLKRPVFASDLHHMPLPDACFDGLFCLHVLEHVRDDRRCIAELHRVLRPGGQAVLMVPFMMDLNATEEYGAPDPNLFGHVRGYAYNDFADRLDGFDVEIIDPLDIMTPEEQVRFGTPDHQRVYICTKRGDT